MLIEYLQTSTSALFNRKPEPRCFRIKTLLLNEEMELRGCACGEFNHIVFLRTNCFEVKWACEKAPKKRGVQLQIARTAERRGGQARFGRLFSRIFRFLLQPFSKCGTISNRGKDSLAAG